MTLEDLVPREIWEEVAENLGKAALVTEIMDDVPMPEMAIAWLRMELAAENPQLMEVLASPQVDVIKAMLAFSTPTLAAGVYVMMFSLLENAYQAGRRSMLPSFIMKEE